MRYQKKIVIATLVGIAFFAVKKLVTNKLETLSSGVEMLEEQIDEKRMTSEEICDYISK